VEYDTNNPKPVQSFDVNNKEKRAFTAITFQIKSNWGNPNYACIYRLRVHGQPTDGLFATKPISPATTTQTQVQSS